MIKEFPTAEEILEFISESDLPAHKSEIAKAFRIHGDARTEMNAILTKLEDKGLVIRKGKNYTAKASNL